MSRTRFNDVAVRKHARASRTTYRLHISAWLTVNLLVLSTTKCLPHSPPLGRHRWAARHI